MRELSARFRPQLMLGTKSAPAQLHAGNLLKNSCPWQQREDWLRIYQLVLLEMPTHGSGRWKTPSRTNSSQNLSNRRESAVGNVILLILSQSRMSKQRSDVAVGPAYWLCRVLFTLSEAIRLKPLSTSTQHVFRIGAWMVVRISGKSSLE